MENMKQNWLFFFLLIWGLVTRVEAIKAIDSKHLVKEKKFTFAIIGDPQVASRAYKKQAFVNAWQQLELISKEISESEKKVAFTISMGDIVNSFEPRSLANFTECVKNLNTPLFLVHGNHDSKFPYTEYREYSEKMTGISDMYYSFDAGNWHFIITPSQIDTNHSLMQQPGFKEYVDGFTQWLKADLVANKDKPTAVFQHFHAIPLGLTQLEWYTPSRNRRQELMNILSEHGNVKYFFNGHIHNGIHPAVKLTKIYRGITFVTVPSGILTRPFQDEFPEYRLGDKTGGYYMTVDVKGDKFTLYGHLAGNPKPYKFPDTFEVIDESTEPRWFYNMPERESIPFLVNGNFKDGLEGWNKVYRYQGDYFKAFVVESSKVAGHNCATIGVRAPQPDLWGNDEFNEIYQIVDVKGMSTPRFKTELYFEKLPQNGGGFIRIVGMNKNGHCCTFFFRWGHQYEYNATFIPRAMDYEMHGTPAKWSYLIDLAKDRKIVFMDIPEKAGKWMPIDINLAEIYDIAVGKKGAFAKMNIDRVYLGLAAWANKEAGSESFVNYSNVSLRDSKNSPMTIDGMPVNYEHAFQTDFGRQVSEAIIKKQKRLGSKR